MPTPREGLADYGPTQGSASPGVVGTGIGGPGGGGGTWTGSGPGTQVVGANAVASTGLGAQERVLSGGASGGLSSTTPGANYGAVTPTSMADVGLAADQYPVWYPYDNSAVPWRPPMQYPQVSPINAQYQAYEVAAAFWGFSDAEIASLESYYRRVNGHEPTRFQLQTFWEQYVMLTGAANHANDSSLTPWDLLEISSRGTTDPGAGFESGPQTTVSTERRIDLTDPDTARGILNATLVQALGRRANQHDVDVFLNTLRSAEYANPSVSTTTTTSVPGQGVTNVATETVAQGGVNPNVLAEDYAVQQEDYGEFQAATTYLQAFIDAVRGF